jgi:hypothetical protein
MRRTYLVHRFLCRAIKIIAQTENTRTSFVPDDRLSSNNFRVITQSNGVRAFMLYSSALVSSGNNIAVSMLHKMFCNSAAIALMYNELSRYVLSEVGITALRHTHTSPMLTSVSRVSSLTGSLSASVSPRNPHHNWMPGGVCSRIQRYPVKQMRTRSSSHRRRDASRSALTSHGFRGQT